MICIVFGLDGVGQHLYSIELLGINKSNAKSSYEIFSNEFKTTDRYILNGALHFQSSAYISSEETSQYAELKGFTVKSFQILYQEENKTHKPSYHLKAGPNQDCPNATMICSDSSFNGNASGYGTQELYGSSPSNRGCLIGEVDQNFKGIVIEYYDDHTVEKRVY